jgi:glycosyltransferase involved in cell wall biosynthesis
MACGTPVVGFDVGGIPDMVRPKISGAVAPVGDSAALRDAIMDLLNNPQLQQEMSENCRRIAVQEYSLQTQAQNYVRYYESILAGSATRD